MVRITRLHSFIIAGLLLFSGLLQASAVIVPASPPVPANSHILMDFASGQVLSEHDADERVEPASLTKMMTMYVVDYEIRSGRLSPDELVLISEKAWKAEGSRMFVEVNSQVPVSELIRGLIVQSGNDASIALAEHIAGSEQAFVAMMNQHAEQLGMHNSHFTNATGLPSPEEYSTAHDLAILARALIRDFPDSYQLYSQKWFSYNGIKQPNRNRLLWRNEYVDGIKTGHTDNAGHCLVASAMKDGMRLISVVMGAPDDNGRMDASNKLLTYGFRFFETHKLFDAFQPLKEARVWMGNQKVVPLGATEDIYVTIPQGQYDYMQATMRLDSNVKAPVAEGQTFGKISIMLGDEELASRPLVALSNVEEGGVFRRFSDYMSLGFKKASADESS